MRLLRLATLILGLAGGAIGLWGSPATATPLGAATAASSAGPLVREGLVEKSYWGYRRHYWRPRYYHRRHFYRPRYFRPRYYRPRYHYRRFYRPRYFYHRRYFRPRFYHRRHYGYRRGWY